MLFALARKHPRLAVRAAKGVGKTQWLAALFCWRLFCWENAVIITTATTWTQVAEQLWREIRAFHAGARIPLGGRLLEAKLELGPKWFGLGISTRKPESFAGFHAAVQVNAAMAALDPATWKDITDDQWFALHNDVVERATKVGSSQLGVICDEASGIEERLRPGIQGLLTTPGSWIVLSGNPTRDAGWHHELFHPHTEAATNAAGHAANAPGIFTLHTVDARDAPAAIVSPDWLAYMACVCGPVPEKNPLYQTDVMGIHATSVEFAAFTRALLEAAASNVPSIGLAHIGVDLARNGGDWCVAVLIERNRVCARYAWREDGGVAPDTLKSATIIMQCAAKWGVPAERVHIDITGDRGVYDYLWSKHCNFKVDGVGFGEGPRGDWTDLLGTGPYLRTRRQELHWVLQRLLQEGLFSIPNDPDFMPIWADLTQIQKKQPEHCKAGEWAVELKHEFKARTGRSCDDSDAVICALSRTAPLRVRFRTLQPAGSRSR